MIMEKKLGLFDYLVAALVVVIIFSVFIATNAKAKVYIICVFKTQDIEPYNNAVNGFVDGLKEGGFQENKDYILIKFDMKADMEEGRRIAGIIREQSPDLILAVGNEAAVILKDTIKNVPIIFSVVQDPAGIGLVENLASSGNNLVGSSTDISDELQMKVLKAIMPNLQKIGLIYDPEKSRKKVELASKAAEELGVDLITEPVQSYKDVPEAVRSLIERVDAIFLIPDTTVVTKQSLEYIFIRTIWSKKIVVGFNPYIVKSGALFSLTFDSYDLGRQSGEIATRVMKGAKPNNIASSTPRKTYVVLNLKIAKKINMDIPENIMKQAKEIIE